jgi:hypothetical protein
MVWDPALFGTSTVSLASPVRSDEHLGNGPGDRAESTDGREVSGRPGSGRPAGGEPGSGRHPQVVDPVAPATDAWLRAEILIKGSVVHEREGKEYGFTRTRSRQHQLRWHKPQSPVSTFRGQGPLTYSGRISASRLHSGGIDYGRPIRSAITGAGILGHSCSRARPERRNGPDLHGRNNRHPQQQRAPTGCLSCMDGMVGRRDPVTFGDRGRTQRSPPLLRSSDRRRKRPMVAPSVFGHPFGGRPGPATSGRERRAGSFARSGCGSGGGEAPVLGVRLRRA